MNALPAGYVRRPEGDYEKRCEFVCNRPEGIDLIAVETLIRDRRGRLLRVERSKGALAKRKLRP